MPGQGPSGSQSSPVDDASRKRFQQTAPRPPPPATRPGIYPQQSETPYSESISLPSLRQLSHTPPTPSDRRPGDPLGVHSILNPQPEVSQQQLESRGRRRSAAQMESPSPSDSQPAQSLPSISRPTSVDSTHDEAMPSRPLQGPGRPPPPRHLLSPRSPSMHRPKSLGVLNPSSLNPPTGTIDAHQSPFLSPNVRSYPQEPVTSQPALPTPPAGHRPSYFPNVPPAAPTPPPGMGRPDMRRPSISFPQSGTSSPMTSYSPYSQPASVASSKFETASAGQAAPYMAAPSNSSSQDGSQRAIAMDTERNMIPMAPSGQSSYQIMTIKSQQGHHVQIPVDVQAASKVADEKRKRNAGASARFRARRKEKEREASSTIARLEQQLRDATDDADHYRNERDYFRSLVYQQPSADRLYPRPASPRLRRLSAPSNAAASTTGGGSGSSYSGFSEDPEPRDSERNVRRRTSTYHPVQGPTTTSHNGPQPHQQAYAPPSFPPPQSGHLHNHPPPPPHQQQYDHRDTRPLPEAHQRPVLRDPFASEPNRYDRNWTPVSGRDERRH